jgi:hypothetical protein
MLVAQGAAPTRQDRVIYRFQYEPDKFATVPVEPDQDIDADTLRGPSPLTVILRPFELHCNEISNASQREPFAEQLDLRNSHRREINPQ